PGRSDLLKQRAAAYELSGQLELAREDADALVKAYPNDASALNQACWLRAKLGRDLETARAECSLAVQLSGGDWRYVNSRGLVGLQQHRF
ncbi:hypothetical protein, partial [Rhizobium phaseoli]|uniref:hypothetical protein n=1 Tax=Rhizobium phaseoli TaxID=396 RepID=UPI0016B471F7|nr:hypothetical protein [Rhizobium phaseoli]